MLRHDQQHTQEALGTQSRWERIRRATDRNEIPDKINPSMDISGQRRANKINKTTNRIGDRDALITYKTREVGVESGVDGWWTQKYWLEGREEEWKTMRCSRGVSEIYRDHRPTQTTNQLEREIKLLADDCKGTDDVEKGGAESWHSRCFYDVLSNFLRSASKSRSTLSVDTPPAEAAGGA